MYYAAIAVLLVVCIFMLRDTGSSPKTNAGHQAAPTVQYRQSIQESVVRPVAQAAPPVKNDAYAWLDNSDIDRVVQKAKGIQLTEAQLKFMQARYDAFLDQEKQLDARLATSETVKAGEVLITIPPHADSAKSLYSQFETEMAAYLGAQTSTEFFNECGPTLAALNADFGAQERQILVDRNDNLYRVVDKTASTTVPGLPEGVTSNGVTQAMVSNLAVNGDLSVYRYLGANFP